jgi:hypothetical protein
MISKINFFVMTMLAMALMSPVKVFADAKSCQLVSELSRELGCSAAQPQASTTAPPDFNPSSNPNAKDFLVNSTFGPSQCKTQDLAKEITKDLKTECTTWIKERKDDLGPKYLTGSCSEQCEDCTMGLKRCSVKGVVHYTR